MTNWKIYCAILDDITKSWLFRKWIIDGNLHFVLSINFCFSFSFIFRGKTSNFEMPKKIAPLVSESNNNSKSETILVDVAGVTQMFGGILVVIFNILFIYFGMSSKWYHFQDSLGTELKVISIGEGIIAGFFYFVFGAISLSIFKSQSHGLLFALNIINAIIRKAFML